MTVTPLSQTGRASIAARGWGAAHKWLLIRRTCQLSILTLFLLGPLIGIWLIKGNLASSLVLDTVPLLEPLVFLQMLAGGITNHWAGLGATALIGVLLVSGFYVLIGGRVFCSFVCPMNMVTDTARWLRCKLALRGGIKLRRKTRLFVLAGLLVVSAFTGMQAYELINPVSILYRGLIFGMGLGWLFVLAVFAFDLLYAGDGWCGHICPMGALYSLIGSKSLLRVRATRRDKCDGCMECFTVCPENHVIPPALKALEGTSPVITSGDCTNCGRCIDICHEHVFQFGPRQ